MLSLYEYFDYQLFLREYIDSQKKEKSWFSYRYFASRLNIDHSNFIKIILGKRHASKQNVVTLSAFLKLNVKEADYLKTLVEFNKSKNDAKSKRLFEKLLTIKNINLKKLDPHQYDYYKQWYHTAIYSLLDYYEFRGDYNSLAAELNPPITPKQAKESISLLEKLHLLRRNDDGRYVQAEKMVTSGQFWHSFAIQHFQEETIDLAKNALSNVSRDDRDISTLTMSLTKSDMQAIKVITEQYRKDIIKVINESGPGDAVYQLNIQLFPLTKTKWSLQ